MASRSLDVLVPEIRSKIIKVINDCDGKGVDILAYCTLRTLSEQAILYRQSRTLLQIESKAKSFRTNGFGFLADILIEVGPQKGVNGRHVTYAGPGESWHNFGEAVDCVPLEWGKAMWDNKHPHWQIYGNACVENGLQWAGNWKNFKEFPHCQLRGAPNPLKQYQSVSTIRGILKNNGLL